MLFPLVGLSFSLSCFILSVFDSVLFYYCKELEDCRERKLCLHERDFVPGRGIASNIVEAIVASRKVILVISRKYATSSWCQYEVQVALAQLHKRRSGRLLVPVLLEVNVCTKIRFPFVLHNHEDTLQ